MRLDNHALLDALCAEYIIGTLRGGARLRFERALREEPRTALRLHYWEAMTPRYSDMMKAPPPARIWQRLERELGLSRYRAPWHQRVGFWKGWAAVATAALVLALGIELARREPEAPPVVQVAQLSGKDQAPGVAAYLSSDRRTLVLRAKRPVLAGPGRSYELWLIPIEGGDPISVAVLGSLDAKLLVPPAQAGRLRPGATLAVSAEPAGGSPTGKPTGPVILVGRITS